MPSHHQGDTAQVYRWIIEWWPASHHVDISLLFTGVSAAGNIASHYHRRTAGGEDSCDGFIAQLIIDVYCMQCNLHSVVDNIFVIIYKTIYLVTICRFNLRLSLVCCPLVDLSMGWSDIRSFPHQWQCVWFLRQHSFIRLDVSKVICALRKSCTFAFFLLSRSCDLAAVVSPCSAPSSAPGPDTPHPALPRYYRFSFIRTSCPSSAATQPHNT